MIKGLLAAITVTTLFTTACSGSGTPSTSPIAGAVIFDMNPSGMMPLGGVLTFTTPEPVRVTLTTGDGTSSITATPNDIFETEHELIVLGLRPGRINTVDLTFEYENGSSVEAASLEIETLPLPARVPPLEVVVSQPDRMEPGITLQPVFNDNIPDAGFILGLDHSGDVIWFYDSFIDEPRRLSNGNLLAILDSADRAQLIEFDMLGRVVREWRATGIAGQAPAGTIPVATDTFHHDILEMPSGNFLAISTEIRHIDNYRGKRFDPTAENPFIEVPAGPQDVVADRIIEFVPETGEIVRSFSVADLIDTSRESFGAFQTDFYEPAYASVVEEPLPDWTHVNGIDYDQATDTAVISIRKFGAVIKLDLSSGELVWILSNPAGWGEGFQDLLLEPIGDIEWTYGQHAPELQANGNLLLYDNGSYGRAWPPGTGAPAPERYSRAIEFEIDEDDMTVREAWSFGGPGSEHFYSEFVSEADRQPQTGNTLITNGGQMVTENGAQTANFADGRVWLSVMEVTNEVPPQKVWQFNIDTPDDEWGSYRSERLPSLYP